MISITMVGDRELIARLEAFPSALRAILRQRVHGLTLRLQALVQRKLSGSVLKVQTGALRRSIQSDVRETDSSVLGRVFSTGDVKYAAIHEFGGIIKHPGGAAYIPSSKKEGMMMFISNANATAGMPRTRPHDITIPERSFLRSSLRDMAPEIRRTLGTGVIESAMRRGM